MIKMKFIVVVFLAALAMGKAEECGEEKAEQCVDNLLTLLLGDTTEEEVCRELRLTVDCLRNAAEECLRGQSDEEVEEGLRELENLIKDNCQNIEMIEDPEEAAMAKCFDDNEEYMYECIFEGQSKGMSLVMTRGSELKEDALICSMYSFMANCFVDRAREKCGSKAADVLEEELQDAPQEIQDACNNVGELEMIDFSLLRKKK
ncbi:uncharacterized protein LOC118186560 [Stegodyphus dumicola]|uniref:uncharacterized protein LOC118186560 n=1 Tax=Stegodyphus dumicola TaxID=202533 RepID=UPI0015B0556F|nr:uncharacterized protein LOC118186560 [Stegodyphus dumicola]